jgi:hypothetical protein
MRQQSRRLGVLALAGFLSLLGCSEQKNSRVATKLNQDASLVGANLPLNPLGQKVITSWIDRQNSTMSTLYGNEAAVQYARTHSEHEYPPGSVLALATWNEQEDERWFGGRIPGKPKSVEFVFLGTTPERRLSYVYQRFEGAPLKQVVTQQSLTPGDRASFLLSQRAAVMP